MRLRSVAREWFEKRKHEWAPSSADTSLPVSKSISFRSSAKGRLPTSPPRKCLPCFASLKAAATLETARRVMQMCGQVFMYAIATGRAERNPVPDLRGALKTPVVKHHSFLKASDLPEYLKNLDAYDGSLQTKLALRFLLLTFVRTTELRGGAMDGD